MIAFRTHIFHKLSCTTINKEYFELHSDDELMLMCTLLPKSRIIDIYVVGTPLIAMKGDMLNHEEEITTENPFSDSTHRED